LRNKSTIASLSVPDGGASPFKKVSCTNSPAIGDLFEMFDFDCDHARDGDDCDHDRGGHRG